MTKILASAVEDMRRHARAAAPEECCGVLLGRGGAVLAAVACRNSAAGDRTRTFGIDPEEILRARRPGMSIAGFYHSHVGRGAHFSAADAAGGWPDALNIVLAVEAGEVGEICAYRIAREALYSSESRRGPGAPPGR